MKRYFIIGCAVLFLAAFSMGDLIGAEKAQPVKQKAATGKTAKAPVREPIETILGTVTAVDPEKKTLTVRAHYETEYYITGTDTATREFIADDAEVTFDIAKAKLVGFTGIRNIHTGSHVRVGYDRKDGTLVAHAVILVPSKQDRSIVRTFLGTVTATDEAKKTLTVKAILEGEFYAYEENTRLKEYVLDEKDITFDTSRAIFVGNKKIDKGDTVRVGFDEKRGAYMAHTVLKIEKR